MITLKPHGTIRTMPCPYFLPLERFDAGITARFPLGDAYRGVCHNSAQVYEPDDATLLASCNMGYAAGRCARFESGEGPDAVRFAPGGGDTVLYAREKNHFPFDAGELTAPFEGILGAQAQAFRESYLRRIWHGSTT